MAEQTEPIALVYAVKLGARERERETEWVANGSGAYRRTAARARGVASLIQADGANQGAMRLP